MVLTTNYEPSGMHFHLDERIPSIGFFICNQDNQKVPNNRQEEKKRNDVIMFEYLHAFKKTETQEY